MKIRSFALPLLGAAALLTVLAGCTNASDKDASPKPSSTQSQPAPKSTGVADESNLKVPAETAQTHCENGVATIADNTKNIPDKVDCAKVIVTGNDSIIHLGNVENLVVQGNLNRIELDSVKTVTVDKTAQTNDIIFGGSKPTIDDKGSNNQFAAAK